MPLFGVLHRVLDAADHQTRNSELPQWVYELGVLDNCDPCA